MTTWENYFELFFERYRSETLNLEKEIPISINFAKSCQVEVVHFKKKSIFLWVITHDESRHDKEINVIEKKQGDPLEFIKRRVPPSLFGVGGSSTFVSSSKQTPRQIIDWYYIEE